MARRRLWLMRINRSADLPLLTQRDRPFEPDIMEALDPQQVVARYGRNWRLARPQRLGDEPVLFGKLGFESIRTDEPAVRYDEEAEDFITIPGSRGHGQFSYLVLDLDTRYLIFEERRDVRRTAFATALRMILRQAPNPEVAFDAEFVADMEEFSNWLTRTDRVTRFFVSVRQPNPDWDEHGDAIVRRLLEDSNAAQVNLEAKPPQDGPGLQITGTGLQDFVDYTRETFGVVRATGVVDRNRRFFDSGRNVASTDIETVENETEETYLRRLLRSLRSLL